MANTRQCCPFPPGWHRLAAPARCSRTGRSREVSLRASHGRATRRTQSWLEAIPDSPGSGFQAGCGGVGRAGGTSLRRREELGRAAFPFKRSSPGPVRVFGLKGINGSTEPSSGISPSIGFHAFSSDICLDSKNKKQRKDNNRKPSQCTK